MHNLKSFCKIALCLLAVNISVTEASDKDSTSPKYSKTHQDSKKLHLGKSHKHNEKHQQDKDADRCEKYTKKAAENPKYIEKRDRYCGDSSSSDDHYDSDKCEKYTKKAAENPKYIDKRDRYCGDSSPVDDHYDAEKCEKYTKKAKENPKYIAKRDKYCANQPPVNTEFCELYPLTLASSLVEGKTGDAFHQIPFDKYYGNIGWLSWYGKKDSKSLAASLIPPGNSDTYKNPKNSSDRKIEVDDWVGGMPGVKKSKYVREGLNELLGKTIRIPVWSQREGKGSKVVYQIDHFAEIEITDYELGGKGWLSFIYKGPSSCYNQAPVAINESLSTEEDTALSISLGATDEDGDALSFTIVESVKNGTLSGDAPNLSYLPNANFSGSDQLTFQVNDGLEDSNIAVVDITITAVNDAPTVLDQTLSLNEDSSVPVVLQGSDVDGDNLSFQLVTGPNHGVLSGTAPNLTYTPNENFNGVDRFTFIANDGELNSDEATVTLTINPVNDAPSANDATYSTEETQPVTIELTGNDIDGDSLGFRVDSQPLNGQLSGTAPNLVYTAFSDFIGEDSFTFVATDGLAESLPAEIKITVKEINRPPQITSTPLHVAPEQSTYQYQVLVSDPNLNDEHRYDLISAPAGVSIDQTTGLLSWDPEASYVGSVPTFNRQCYIVPADAARVYDPEQDEETPAYLSPLFQRVKAALESSGDFTARETIAWDTRHKCLGCHIQGQGYFGLKSAAEKIEVDLDAIDYLYNEFLEHQIANGAIVDHVPNRYLVTQSSQMIWALSAGKDRLVSFDARMKLLEHIHSLHSLANDAVFWRKEDNKGYVAWTQGTTALITIGIARAIEDAQKLTPTPEQQATLDKLIDLLSGIGAYFLTAAKPESNYTLFELAFPLIGLSEVSRSMALLGQTENPAWQTFNETRQFMDSALRSRQLASGGWAYYGNGTEADPLISAWVGMALDYAKPPITDPVVTRNIEYLLESQTAQGTWTTQTGLFSTPLGTTGLVMAYLPIALEFLGNPDLRTGEITHQDLANGRTELSIELSNRGLTDLNEELIVQFFSGDSVGQALASTSINSLKSTESKRVTVEIDDSIDASKISVSISRQQGADPNFDECLVNNNQSTAALIKLRATDLGGLSDTQQFVLNIQDINEAPTLVAPESVEQEGGQALAIELGVNDPDRGDAHEFALQSAIPGTFIDSRTGKITSDPRILAAGQYTLEVTVTDLRGLSDSKTIALTVNENLPPTIVSEAPESVSEKAGFLYQAVATDPNPNDVLQYGLDKNPVGMRINRETGEVLWDAPLTHVEPLATTQSQCVKEPAANSSFLPTLKWHWNTESVLSVPMVGKIVDTNGDSRVDKADDTTVVFISHPGFVDGSSGVLRAVNGRTGEELWSLKDSSIRSEGSTHPSYGDITGDGQPEIIMHLRQGGVIALRNDGTELWRSSEPARPGACCYYGAINIADLDGDGNPEVLARNTVLNSDGSMKWQVPEPVFSMASGLAADLDGDGFQEVILGNRVYRHDGSLYWEASDIFTAHSAVGNFDDDPFPEVVFTGSNVVRLFEHDGVEVWTSAILNNRRFAGAPTVADVDGDGKPNIGVAGSHRYVVYREDGTILWSQAVRDYSSSNTGSTVFDFNNDGKVELVYADEGVLRIYDGPTGEVIFSIANSSATASEYPVVADIDGDGAAEILVGSDGGSTRGLRAFEDLNDQWAPTRSQWNQYQYSITNINNDGTIPTQVDPSWLVHNTFRLNAFIDRDALAQADLIVHRLGFDDATNTLKASVTNRGLAPSQTSSVMVFQGDLDYQGEVIGSIDVPQLDAGESHSISIIIPADQESEKILFSVNFDRAIEECDYSNNKTVTSITSLYVLDSGGLRDSQRFVTSITNENDPPEISSASISTLTIGEFNDLFVEVSDPDLGDAFTYSLEGNPSGISINQRTGELRSTLVEPGIFEFTITVSDLGGLSTSQQHTLTLALPDNQRPTFVSEPPLQVEADNRYDYQVEAIDPDGDDIFFSLAQLPIGMSIDGITGQISWLPSLDQVGIHLVTVVALDNRGAQRNQDFVIEVTDPNANNQAPVITSVPSGVIFAGTSWSYTVEANDPDNDPLSYQLLDAPAGMTMDNAGKITWLASPEQVGSTFLVTIRVSDDRGAATEQTLTLPVSEAANRAPQINSVPATEALVGSLYNYTIQTSDPDGDSVALYLEQGPRGMTLNGFALQWTPSEDQAGERLQVVVRVQDSRGAASRQQFFILVAGEGNTAPRIVSQPPANAVVDSSYQYAISAVDADGDALRFNLSQAPTGAKLVDNVLLWTPTESQLGQQRFTLQVNDGKASTSQSWLVSVNATDPQNQYPELNSQPVFQAFVGLPYRYALLASDPNGDSLTYSLQQGPDGMSIDASGVVTWVPGPDQVQTYPVVLSVSDGKGITLQSYDLQVLSEPEAVSASVIISPKAASQGELVTVSVLIEGGLGAPVVNVTFDGVPIALDSSGQVQVSSDVIGRHDIVVTVSENGETDTVSEFFTVKDDSDTEAPVVAIESPDFDSTHLAPFSVVASISDDNLASYRVLLSPRGQGQWRELATGNENVTSEVVATVDTTQLMNGWYDVAIEAIDVNDARTVDSSAILVEGDLKVGNFSFTVEDLSIPLVGIPIRVTRTYDSRRRFENLDFGYGWSIDYQNVKVEESRTPGLFWALNEYRRGPFGVIADFCVEPKGAPVISVTLPDGDVESFEVQAEPRCNSFSPILDVRLTFEPVGDTQSTLTSSDNGLQRYSAQDGNLGDIADRSVYNPTRYTLTTQAGFVYELDQEVGLTRVIDPNGNTLTYTDDGIFHSSGQAITFQRNSDGQIIAITDPSGNVLRYDVNAAGDLVAMTDAVGATTQYTYQRDHAMVDIIDPLGRPLLKNIYDDSGKLIAQEDGQGNRSEFNHDLDGRQSVVTDRLGRSTVLYYNERGDVTSQVNALGEVTTMTYDLRGNQLSVTNALGHRTEATFDDSNNQLTATDALGNVTAYTYNPRGQELTIIDAKGRVFENTYDSVGNLLSIKDPLGNIAGNQIDAKGQVTRTIDALGNATDMTYDDKGNKLSETNAEGERTDFTYDDNGNVLSETRTRNLADGSTESLVTRFEYDGRNRVIKTVNPLGQVSQNEYDLAGQLVATIDTLGRRTEMDYDAYGRLLTTRYHDGTSEAKAYDVEGNLLSETDRNGNTTTFAYDALNRIIKTTYADGSSTENNYDAAGRVIAARDARGNETRYIYDAADRRTQVINALGQVHRFEYDENGNLVKEIDALGQETQHVYNALDQKTETIFADGQSSKVELDALERTTAKIDASGVRTAFVYDKVGRLTQVTDALKSATRYGFDELGNQITQTDAEGRVTTWAYDTLGREISRTLPLGQSDETAYDELGRRASYTDFNGQRQSYTYDEADRVVAISYHNAAGEVEQTETFSYDALGNRLSASTLDGTYRYSYDERNRLVSEVDPQGHRLEYTYDEAGNRTQVKTILTGGETRTVDYSFDALNRLATVTDASGTTTYRYNAVGSRERIEHSNGTVTEYQYDSRNRLTQLIHKDASDTVIGQYSYTLAPTGHRLSIVELDGRRSDYTYDALYRMTKEVITDSARGNHSAEYQFDRASNRTYSIINGVHTAYTIDANDRLLQQGGTRYTYDDNGNTLTETLDGQVTTYRYDARNKLVEHKTASGEVTTYRYNADGIRVGKTANSNNKTYLVDSNRDYAQVLVELNGNSAQVNYTYGDDLLNQSRGGTTHTYHVDGLGSTRALSSQAGTLSDTYHYDAYGELLHETGTTENDYRFTGEQYDAGLDQYYLRARYYDASAGRFTQMDTWMGRSQEPVTLHKYLYTNGSPQNNIDPSGNIPVSISGALRGAETTARLAVASVMRSAANFAISRTFVGAALKGGALMIKKELRKCIKTRGKKCRILIPIVVVGNDYPNQRAHIWDAQIGQGENFGGRMTASVLRYQKSTLNRNWPRGSTPRGLPNSCDTGKDLATATEKFGGVVACDEYPFSSSREGGYKNYKKGRVSLRYIPNKENTDFGFRILSRLRAKPGQRFLVAAFPWIPKSTVIDVRRGKK